MKKKLIILGALTFLFTWYYDVLFAQDSCVPILTYDDTHSLCNDGNNLLVYFSSGIPSGCQHLDENVPYEILRRNSGDANWVDFDSETNNFYEIAASELAAGRQFAVRIELEDISGEECSCSGQQTSNAITISGTPAAPSLNSGIENTLSINCGDEAILSVGSSDDVPGGIFHWYAGDDSTPNNLSLIHI